MSTEAIAAAINRLACAQEAANKLGERSIALHEQQAHVTAQLEASLAMQAAGPPRGNA